MCQFPLSLELVPFCGIVRPIDIDSLRVWGTLRGPLQERLYYLKF